MGLRPIDEDIGQPAQPVQDGGRVPDGIRGSRRNSSTSWSAIAATGSEGAVVWSTSIETEGRGRLSRGPAPGISEGVTFWSANVSEAGLPVSGPGVGGKAKDMGYMGGWCGLYCGEK